MKKPIHYIMRHARRARIVISTRTARWTLTGFALAGALIGFGVMAQAVPGLRQPSERGAERLLVEMGGDQSAPRENRPEAQDDLVVPPAPAPREEPVSPGSSIETRIRRRNRVEPARSRNSNREQTRRQPERRAQQAEPQRPQPQRTQPVPVTIQPSPVRLDSQGPVLTGFPTNLNPKSTH